MRVAFISDLHLDVNRIDPEKALGLFEAEIKRQAIDVLILAGDTFNSLEKTSDFVQTLAVKVGPGPRLFYLAGNHEMGSGESFETIEDFDDPHYLHKKYLDIGSHRLIGHNGWYDYSMDKNQHTIEEIASFKKRNWYDRRIKQPMTDQERMALAIAEMETMVEEAKKAGQKVVMVNHFSPLQAFVDQIPFRKSKMTILKAFLGSAFLGRDFVKWGVESSISGHLHLHPEKQQVAQTSFYNVALGYNRRRIMEWSGSDFYQEVTKRMLILDL
ncbi:hypothetical protein G6R29_03020 [Fructobacillus sp. M2-14]|uniref:Calcineurin-like phosphoesterase domain-containing protein n=1 Tax=Fructobacillus broussonetiae TaxID=2713173 RepID=A0ABS5QZH3_9LACO|nr:metallophosphoesterase [Fructobacillus broussonetiae]MBS9338605.1 hypothetical protein [Fructobacillus broussonetiae]